MYYSQEVVDEVIARNDIVDVISGYVHLQKKGSNYFGLCPFHSEKSPSFSVSASKQMYYCFGCGAGGSVLTFIMEYENYSFREALKFLADRAGMSLPEEEYSPERKRQESIRSRILELNKLAANYFYYQLHSKSGELGLQYLRQRGLSGETMKKFGLGFANKYGGDLYRYLKGKGYKDDLLRESGLMNADEKHGMQDKFWNRVIFPILDVNNRVIGFGGRVMGEGTPKYLNSPETKVFDKSRNLYGLNHARKSRRKNLILCEGYMDVIALHQAGFDQAVASLGTAFTPGQAGLLKRYADEALIAYDSDEAGTKAALRAIPLIKGAGMSAKVVSLEPYKDPDEFIKNLGTEAFEERAGQAENSFFYETRVLERNYNLEDPEEKTRFHTEIAKKLLSFEEEIERENYLQAVAEKYQIGFAQLRKLVNTCAARGERISALSRPKSGVRSKREAEDGASRSQKLLLTWLVEEPGIYPVIKPHIGPEDFTEEPYHKIAELLFDQLERGVLNPAAIVSRFDEEEQQREAASVFHTRLADVDSKTEREKALKDIMLKVKKHSLECLARTGEGGIDAVTRLVENRKALEALQNTHISLD